MTNSSSHKRLWYSLGIIALVGLTLWLFFHYVDLKVVAGQLHAVDPTYLLPASGLMLAGMLAYAGRWRQLLANEPGLIHTFHASNIGHAGNILLPVRAGEAARILVMGRSSRVSVTAATSSFVVERLFEQVMRLIALFGMLFFGIGLAVNATTLGGGIAAILLAAVAIAWTVTHDEIVLEKGPRLLAKLPWLTEERARVMLTDFLSSLQTVSSPRALLLGLLWSAVTWLFFWGASYLTLLALGSSLTASQQLAISLGVMVVAPLSTPTQPGLFHISIVAPLAAAGYPAAVLTAYAVLLHLLQMAWMCGLGAWGMLRERLSPLEMWSA